VVVAHQDQRTRQRAALLTATCYGLVLLFIQGTAHSDVFASGAAHSWTFAFFGWPLRYFHRETTIALPTFELEESIVEWHFVALLTDGIVSLVLILAIYHVSSYVFAWRSKWPRFTIRDLLCAVSVICLIATAVRIYQLFPRVRPLTDAFCIVVLVGVVCSAVCLVSSVARIGAWLWSPKSRRDVASPADSC
jgi:hypothetical protein